MEARLNKRIDTTNKNTQALKKDIARVKSDIQKDITHLRGEVKKDVASLSGELTFARREGGPLRG